MKTYFKFSTDQLEMDKSVYNKMNKIYKPKYVIYNGRKVQYTEMNTRPDSRFSDAKIVAEFESLNNVVYGEI